MESSTSAAGASTPAAPPSRRRRLAFFLCLVVLLYAATELLLFAAISIRYGRVFTFSAFEAQKRDVSVVDPFGMGDVPGRVRVRKEVVHPYLGYVYDPTVERSSPYGISESSPVQHRRDDTVIIGIFGGSFADDLASNMGDALTDQLKARFPDKRFEVVKGAIGGYKQPQQLMALNYFMALGGDFDIIINLDGFNEIALPPLENLPNTNPFYPRQWHLRMRMVPNREFLATIGQINYLDSLAADWVSLFRTGLLRYSVTANTVWRIGDQLLYLAALKKREQLPKMAQADGYAAAGPPAPFANDDELYASLGRMWAESSYQMHALARARGARYFHFLQPNQYLDGTKPMGPEERRIAIIENHPYDVSVTKAYPVLKALGRELGERGVNFVDLTNVFADTSEVLYRDRCCHVSSDGIRIVATAIGKAIDAGLNRDDR